MKNIVKLFGIIALVALIGLGMAACEMDPGDDNVAKTLVITGVPVLGEDSLNGKLITVAICDLDKNNKPVIRALNQATGAATVTIPLLSGNDKKKGASFTGTGLYYIFLFVDESNTPDNLDDDATYFYTGSSTGVNPLQYDIQNDTSTIGWDNFKKQTS